MSQPPRRDEIDRELRDHLDLELEERIADGAKSGAARTAALRAFGNPVVIREQVRDLSPWRWWERLVQDVRYARRSFLRTPAFTATAVLSLALGIGANTAIFSVVDAALLRALPVSHPEQLVALQGNFSYPDYVALRRGNHTLLELTAASSLNKAVIGIGNEAEQAAVKIVSGNYFTGLGVPPGLGRVLAPADETEPVAVLSHGYWVRRFTASPAVLGQTIRVNSASLTIVGVGPAGFSGEAPGESPDIWTSMALQPPASRNDRGFSWLYLMGRVEPGQTPDGVQGDLSALAARPDGFADVAPRIAVAAASAGASKLQNRFADPLRVVMAIAALVLLVACANLASLLLTRGEARRGEIAMRLAIGATRARVIRQLLTESLLLAGAGGALGLACAEWGSAALLRIASTAGADAALDVRPDARSLLFTTAVSLAAGWLFGLAPAIRAVRQAAGSLAPESGARLVAGHRRWQSRDTIIAAQIALSLILLAACGMFVRTLRNLEQQDLGFRTDGVLIVDLLRERGYRPALDTLVPELIERAASIPGVEAASVAFGGTLANSGGITGLEVEGYTPRDPQDRRARADWVGPGYFRTAGIELESGRDFLPADRDPAQKVAIVNQQMARYYFGVASAIGRRFTWNENAYEIVGVAKNAKYSDLRESTPRVIYFPVLQGGSGINSVEVRTSGGNPLALAPMVRAAIRDADPRLSAGDMTTLASRLDRRLGREHLVADLAGFFGTLTLALLSVGLYGTLAYTVGRRTKEIGVRLALGAGRAGVIWLVLRHTAVILAVGIALGLAGVLAAGRLVRPLLFGIASTDPAAIGGAVAVLTAVALVAAVLPAFAMQLAPLDWAVLVAYFVLITAIGLAAGRHVRKTGEFFLGQRTFGPWLMIGQSFGVGTHAEMPVALAGAVYTSGASAIWFQWKNLFITPFYWIMAPVFRRIRRTTMAEFTEDRYGRWMGAIYTVFAVCFLVINTGSMLKGAAKVISQALGGGVGVNEIVVAMTVLFMVYSLVGGLVAAAWTDLFQSVLIIVLSFMLIPVGWRLVGGLAGMHASLEPFRFSLATPSGIGPWAIAMLTVNGLVGIMAQPHMMAAVGTGRGERTCRIGMLAGNMVKRVCTVGWALVGLIVAAVIAQGRAGVGALGDPENTFGFACRLLLAPGALGLMIACILAANMSTCSAFLVDSGALFTEGLYRRHLAPDRPDRHYLRVGRVSGLAITLLGVAYAIYLIQSVLYTFLLTETLATFIGISVLGGIVWRRANRWGAVSSLAGALATNFALYAWTGKRLDAWDPNVFLAALGAGIVLLVAVSLATEPEPAAALASLFGRLDTSSDAGGEHRREPLLLVNILRLRREARGRGWRAYDEDLRGFAIGWLVVVVLVGATVACLKMGQ